MKLNPKIIRNPDRTITINYSWDRSVTYHLKWIRERQREWDREIQKLAKETYDSFRL